MEMATLLKDLHAAYLDHVNAEARYKQLQDALKECMGRTTTLDTPEAKVTYKPNKDKTTIDWQSVCAECTATVTDEDVAKYQSTQTDWQGLAQFMQASAELIEKYTKREPGIRPLRIEWK